MPKIVIAAALLVIVSITAAIILPRLGPASTEIDDAPPAADRTDPSPVPAPVTDRAPRADDERAVDRLRAQLSSAAQVTAPTDAQRLADARAWVAANRSADRPFNDLEARILALMSAVKDGGEHSSLWAINAALIEVETLRALDADGDGLLTTAEIQRFLEDETAVPDPLEHPYFADGLDTEAALTAVLERARLEAWDTDRDGFVSPAERAAGEAVESSERVEYLVAQELDRMDIAGTFEDANPTREDTEALLREQFTRSLEGVDLSSAAMLTARNMLYAMQMLDLSDAAIAADLTATMPLPPDFESFDANNDGEVLGPEVAAFNQAIADYDRTILALTSTADLDFYHRRYQLISVDADTNRDGRLSAAEWDTLTARLAQARDDRLFLLSYDLNRDRTVGNDELMQFLDWHKAGSLRADANYDGVVDARDLEHAMNAHQRQSD